MMISFEWYLFIIAMFILIVGVAFTTINQYFYAKSKFVVSTMSQILKAVGKTLSEINSTLDEQKNRDRNND